MSASTEDASEEVEKDCDWDADLIEAPEPFTGRLFVGSLEAATDVQALNRHGITHVLTAAGRLNVFGPWNTSTSTGVLPKHRTVEMADHFLENLLYHLPPCFDFIDMALGHPVPLVTSKILVHCASGVSRSVSVCTAWLMTRLQLPYNEALGAVRSARPRAMPNIGFQQQLLCLEQAGGDTVKARDMFKQINDGKNVADRCREEREAANELHARVDAIEAAFKAGTTSKHDPSTAAVAQRNGWVAQLRQLDIQLGDQRVIQDRPAKMIRKSAASKCACLLQELEHAKVAPPTEEAEPRPDNFAAAFADAFASALTEFDCLDVFFAEGKRVPGVVDMLVEELRADADFAPVLAGREDEMIALTRKMVGTAHGAWKRGGAQGDRFQAKAVKDVTLPWSSIEPYPIWVASLVETYRAAPPEEQEHARRTLEQTLLETPLHAVSIKYDGTCFGKLDSGELVGRRQTLGARCDTYQQTSTAEASRCDVEALRRELGISLGIELPVGSVCAWGELMCNPGYYDYRARQLASTWLCFGVVVQLPEPVDRSQVARCSELLAARGLAYNISPTGRLRLALCPALRRLLREAAGCAVADDLVREEVTHAQAVAQGAAGLAAGANEGLVLVSALPSGQCSLRKWKNSAEGASVSSKHAQVLRSVDARGLVNEGKLDSRIADMLETMISVAEADTAPMKVGRSQVRRDAVGDEELITKPV